jgi:hypothetical protein
MDVRSALWWTRDRELGFNERFAGEALNSTNANICLSSAVKRTGRAQSRCYRQCLGKVRQDTLGAISPIPLVLWAGRITVRRSTGYSAFELVYGRECLLPVQLSIFFMVYDRLGRRSQDARGLTDSMDDTIGSKGPRWGSSCWKSGDLAHGI